MLNLSRVAEQNPWWHEPGAIEQDFHVRAFEASPTKWEPQEIGAFCFDTDAVYTLRGPRQVGRDDVKPLKQMGGGILVSRDAFLVLDGIPVLPAALFLALLSR